MRLSISKSKNATSLYVIKSTYENGVHSSKVHEKLGTLEELKEKIGDQDPIEWAKSYIKELNSKEKEENLKTIISLSPRKLIPKHELHTFNGGYLFLQALYYQLGIPDVCKKIALKSKFTFDLDSILSRLLYARIIYPGSKRSTVNLSPKFLEPPHFEIQHVYRALEVISRETDFLQAHLYQNSLKISKRNTNILYYDCTNYFFETEHAEGMKQYGVSKEHRPSPIVQMGLFMDGNGIPLAFNINAGNTNEQTTLKPLEEKLLADFGCSRFVVCTDAGLSSLDNRRFNSIAERAFITTQSIKKLKKYLRDWALEPSGWKLSGSTEVFNINEIDESAYHSRTFYKQRRVNDDGLEQKLIVTFSLKYRDYQRKIRESQVARAKKFIEGNPDSLGKPRQNDFKRFIGKTHVTGDGEVAKKTLYRIDPKVIEGEKIYDGFYAVCTNLEGDAQSIIQVNSRRWEIEECFRIMKSEFRARPVYLSRDDRIKAHFTTCFIALTLYRLLEKRLEDKFTCCEIIDTLRAMNFLEVKGEGYLPGYKRTDLTDALHEAFNFRTDYEIVKTTAMKKIFKMTKSQ